MPSTIATALLLALLTGAPAAYAQTAVASRTRPHVEILASDRLEGREVGSAGERLAGDYIATQLARVGARALPGRADMFASFEFTAGSRDGGSRISIGRGTAAPQIFESRGQIRALSFSDDGDVTGPVVFAGYGLVVPEAQNFGYDSYATLDVTDKIVVVLRYFPEDADPKTRGILARYAGLRYKALAARQRGAKALLVVTGPRSPNAGETIPMTFDTALAGSGLPAASIGREAADAIFAGATPLRDVQQGARFGESARGRLRPPRRDDHAEDRRGPQKTDRTQRHRVPPRDGARHRTREAVDRRGRALRSPGPRRQGQLAGASSRAFRRASRRRRQRLRYGGCAGDGRGALDAAEPPARGAGALVGRGDRTDRIERVYGDTSSAPEPDRGVSELRHGRPHAGQQVDRAGGRDEAPSGPGCSSASTSPPASTSWSRRIRISQRMSPRLTRRASRASPSPLDRTPTTTSPPTPPTRSTTRISIGSSTWQSRSFSGSAAPSSHPSSPRSTSRRRE